MGFDISNHAVDQNLITGRLIPALRGEAPIDDLLDRAATLSQIAHRANQWGLRVVQLNSHLFDQQLDIAPRVIDRRPAKRNILQRLLGIQKFEEIPRPGRIVGLPGFDSDLSVWGRPFFIVADTPEESLQAFQQYLSISQGQLDDVDAICTAMLAKLDKEKGSIPSDLDPAVIASLDAWYPILDHLPPLEDESQPPDWKNARHRIQRWFAMYQEAWTHKDSERVIESDFYDEPLPASEIAMAAPHALINFAAQLLPGWMGRGHVWPTILFEKIGVDVSDLFETPMPLFASLVEELPELEERLNTTIVENYSLGGYVPPEKICAFRERLQKHRRELILAWDGDGTDEDVERMSADFNKILEPVLLAEQQGYGFIEAAEVYSGFMGAMN